MQKNQTNLMSQFLGLALLTNGQTNERTDRPTEQNPQDTFAIMGVLQNM